MTGGKKGRSVNYGRIARVIRLEKIVSSNLVRNIDANFGRLLQFLKGVDPDVVKKMRGELYRWWNEVGPTANDPQRIVIGRDHENPARLTACEWLDVFVDQQAQIRRGQQKSGYWLLNVDRDGEYEFELRRWPRDADFPLSEALLDGTGKALPIKSAGLYINNYHHQSVGEKKTLRFRGPDQKGKAR